MGAVVSAPFLSFSAARMRLCVRLGGCDGLALAATLRGIRPTCLNCRQINQDDRRPDYHNAIRIEKSSEAWWLAARSIDPLRTHRSNGFDPTHSDRSANHPGNRRTMAD